MSIYTQSRPSLNARMIKILWRQQQELLKKSPDHVIPIINSEDPIDIQADIEGPEGTPYESGIFRVKPKQWSLYNLFEVIKCLLIVPFPQSSLNEEAGKMFMDNYDEYFKVAKMITEIHAKKNISQKCDVIKDKEKNTDIIANKDNNEDIPDNNNNNYIANNNIIINKKEQEENNVFIESENVEMKINNSSGKKQMKIESEKKIDRMCDEIEENQEKDKINISFLNEFSSGDSKSNYSFWNNNNINNNEFNFDNNNIFENITITRSKTIKCNLILIITIFLKISL